MMRVPWFDLREEYASLREEILAALDRVGRDAAFILGQEVEEFEREFAAYCQARYCVALNSGTSALHLGLLAAGVQPGDEVIAPAYTFIATAEAISYTGAKPVFVDIQPATANIDADKIERAINARTRAIVPVDLYGRPADLDAILEIAQRRGLAVVEDACQAHGARYRGRPLGGICNATAFSFYPSKNLAAYGEGGALVTNDDRVAQYARAARSHGQTGKYEHAFIGYNYRMDGFQGAVLRIKLKHLEEWNARRRTLAALYRRLLEGADLKMLEDDPRDQCAYHLFVIYVKQRDAVRTQLQALGVETAIHYPKPLHLQKAYAALGCPAGCFPHAERAAEQTLSLPFFPGLRDAEAERVASLLQTIAGKSRAE